MANDINQQFRAEITSIAKKALEEDIFPNGDITSQATINNNQAEFSIKAREDFILCGVGFVEIIFDLVKESLSLDDYKIQKYFQDGDLVAENKAIISGKWAAAGILMAERLTLNILQHLSAIATKANKYKQKLINKNIEILDSRKTLPNLRILQKYAVKTGGGKNHRFNLSDGILVKDNHITLAGGIPQILKNIKNRGFGNQKIEIECDNLLQVKQCLEVDFVDVIMLDNMNTSQIQEAIKIIDSKTKIEVSGGINFSNIEEISKYTIDYISIGDLTHSVKAVDIGLDM
jgi:nicotinate-nucleotide pyrophosphorylase (carboxylating)